MEFLGCCVSATKEQEEASDAKQPEADNQHAGDRAAAKGDGQGVVQSASGGLSGSDVGFHRDVHADITGQPRQDCADGESECGHAAQTRYEENQQEQDDADDTNGGVLAIEVSLCTLLDSGRDRLHFRVACIQTENPSAGYDAVNHGERPADQSEPDRGVRGNRHRQNLRVVLRTMVGSNGRSTQGRYGVIEDRLLLIHAA